MSQLGLDRQSGVCYPEVIETPLLKRDARASIAYWTDIVHRYGQDGTVLWSGSWHWVGDMVRVYRYLFCAGSSVLHDIIADTYVVVNFSD
jgi:hypothetical protein